MATAMTTPISIRLPLLGPLPNAIGKGPMNTTAPKLELEEEPLEAAKISSPTNSSRNPMR